jgi:rhodanese-related sulfurtransferase
VTEFLSQNILLVVLIIVSGGMLVWPLFNGAVTGAKQIGTLEATRLMNTGDAVFVDVREASEFASGRIPKSKNFPFTDLAKRIAELDKFKAKPVVVTCASGSRSSGAIRLFKNAGFAEIYLLKGGLAAWREASLPVEK